jgi:hypothetical protein
MTKYRKKPVVIDAALYDGNLVGIPSASDPGKVEPMTCPEWFPALTETIHPDNWKYVPAGKVFGDGKNLIIGTLEGPHRASPGDWIIRGIQGEMYPIKPEIFAETYELAEA